MINLNIHFRFITTLLFIVFPFLFVPITQDPELHIRYLTFSLILSCVLIVILFYKKPLSFPGFRNLITGGYLVLILWLAFPLFGTINTGDGVYELSKIITGFIWMILLTGIIHDNPRKKFNWISQLISISALIFCLIAIYQLYKETGFSLSTVNIAMISSTLSNKNFFSETLLLMLPFSVFAIIKSKSFLRIVYCISIFLSVFFIIFLQSATVYLAFAGIIFIIIFLIPYRKLFAKQFSYKTSGKIITVITSSAAILLTVIVLYSRDEIRLSKISDKINILSYYVNNSATLYESHKRNDNSIYDRFLLARNSIMMFKDHPVAGAGLANWKIYFPKYGVTGSLFFSTGKIRYEHPHNDYLLLLTESGLPGLLIWLIIIGGSLGYCIMLYRKNTEFDIKIIIFVLIAVITGFAFISMFSYPRERFFSMIILLTSLAFISVLKNENRQNNISLKKLIPILLILVTTSAFIQFKNYQGSVNMMKALHYQYNKNFASMERYAKKARSPFHTLDMTGTPVNWYIGQALFYQGKKDAAFPFYLKAEKENPFHLQVLNDLGSAYEDRGDHQSALSCFTRVFEINPDFRDARLNEIAVYYNSGDRKKAWELLENSPYRFINPWKENVNRMVLDRTQQYVQETKDTALADHINSRLIKNQFYLYNVYRQAVNDSIAFEKLLHTFP